MRGLRLPTRVLPEGVLAWAMGCRRTASGLIRRYLAAKVCRCGHPLSVHNEYGCQHKWLEFAFEQQCACRHEGGWPE